MKDPLNIAVVLLVAAFCLSLHTMPQWLLVNQHAGASHIHGNIYFGMVLSLSVLAASFLALWGTLGVGFWGKRLASSFCLLLGITLFSFAQFRADVPWGIKAIPIVVYQRLLLVFGLVRLFTKWRLINTKTSSHPPDAPQFSMADLLRLVVCFSFVFAMLTLEAQLYGNPPSWDALRKHGYEWTLFGGLLIVPVRLFLNEASLHHWITGRMRSYGLTVCFIWLIAALMGIAAVFTDGPYGLSMGTWFLMFYIGLGAYFVFLLVSFTVLLGVIGWRVMLASVKGLSEESTR